MLNQRCPEVVFSNSIAPLQRSATAEGTALPVQVLGEMSGHLGPAIPHL